MADLVRPSFAWPEFLAVQAYDQGEVSKGELCDLLRCDRVTAREIVDRHLTLTAVSDDGEVPQIQLETHYSLLGIAK